MCVSPPPVTKRAVTKAPAKKAPARMSVSADPSAVEATDLLVRAIRVGLQKGDDDWVYAAGVKSQMQRMDPTITEKSLGFTTFRDFVESRSDKVLDSNGESLCRKPTGARGWMVRGPH
jgi:hypothetical protein